MQHDTLVARLKAVVAFISQVVRLALMIKRLFG